MDARVRELVRKRAGDRCEYCRLRQELDAFHPFHLEHIVARQHGGKDDVRNLAWACHQCNLHKGPNISGLDPDTNQMVRLFHPRRDAWGEHFTLNDLRIIGRTAIGRTTAWVLQMNAQARLDLRKRLRELGELD